MTGVNGVPKYDHCFVRYKFDGGNDLEPWSKTKDLSTGIIFLTTTRGHTLSCTICTIVLAFVFVLVQYLGTVALD